MNAAEFEPNLLATAQALCSDQHGLVEAVTRDAGSNPTALKICDVITLRILFS